MLIVGLTVVVVMLSIAWRRNHFLNATLSVIGLNAVGFALVCRPGGRYGRYAADAR
ncbi:hypothetical protein ACLB1T_01670 [Escherichia coli]